MTRSNNTREWASLDVSVELLDQLPRLLPGTIQIAGSLASEAPGVVRLLLDVTDSDQPGGAWECVVTDVGAVRTVRLGPTGAALPTDVAERAVATWEAFAKGKCRVCGDFRRVDAANVCLPCATGGAADDRGEEQADG